MATEVENLKVVISGDASPLEKTLNSATKEVGAFSKVVGNNLTNGINKMHDAIKTATLVVGGGIIGLGGAALKSASDFETMRVALETTFQGNIQAARAAEKQITDFAAKTPFQLEEVMQGFIKLKNMGLNPSERALKSYGDTASAMGKSLNDMVEAVADAATGEFERLKEFGIRATQQGDKVTFTFKGVSTTVKKNSKDIENYLIKLGETNFAGGMEKQSKTLSGVLSTLKDNFALTLASIAEDSGLLDAAKSAVSALGDVMGNVATKTKAFFQALNSDDGDVALEVLSKAFSPQMAQRMAKIVDVLAKARTGIEMFFRGLREGNFGALDQFFERIGSDTGRKFVVALQAAYNGIRDFVEYLKQNKDATIFAIEALAAALLFSYVPAVAAAVAASLPFILTIAAIGAAAFFLYRIWTENWFGIRDTLIDVWSKLQPVLLQVWQWLSTNIPQAMQMLAIIYEQRIKPSLDSLWNTISTRLIPVLQEFWQRIGPDLQTALIKLGPYLEKIAGFIGIVMVESLKKGIDSLTDLLNKFADFMNFVNRNYEKIKNFVSLFENIRTANGKGIIDSAKALGIPGFAVGTPFVPNDMIANIHRGEMIVPARFNPNNPNASSPISGDSNNMNITVNNYDTRVDANQLGRQLMFRMRLGGVG